VLEADRTFPPRRPAAAGRHEGVLRARSLMVVAGLGALGALTPVLASGAPAVPPGPPPLGLTVSPAPLTLLGQRQTTLSVVNHGSQPVNLVLSLTNYALGGNGRPLIGPKVGGSRSARSWILLQPKQLHLNPGQRGGVRLLSVPPQQATPGDHQALVLLTATQPSPGRFLVRHRIGVGVLVRVPGPIRRRLAIGAVTARHVGRKDVVRVTVRNLGNINERLARGQVTVQLRRGRRNVATLRTQPRSLLPGTSGVVVASRVGHRRGAFTAVVRLRFARPPSAGPGVSATPRPLVRTAKVSLAARAALTHPRRPHPTRH